MHQEIPLAVFEEIVNSTPIDELQSEVEASDDWEKALGLHLDGLKSDINFSIWDHLNGKEELDLPSQSRSYKSK